MHPKNAYDPGGFTDQSSFPERPFPFDLSPQEATFQLTRRAALTVVLVLSLGLWVVIWAAVATFASAALG